MYGVWTTIDGGATGFREGWLKRDDKPRVFDSYLDAMAACRDAREKTSLRGGVTPSGRPVPHQSFEVKEYTQ